MNELFTVKQLASLLQMGESSIWRYRDAGYLPAPLKIGRSVRWRQSDIMDWINAGCPNVRTTKWQPSNGGAAAQAIHPNKPGNAPKGPQTNG